MCDSAALLDIINNVVFSMDFVGDVSWKQDDSEGAGGEAEIQFGEPSAVDTQFEERLVKPGKSDDSDVDRETFSDDYQIGSPISPPRKATSSHTRCSTARSKESKGAQVPQTNCHHAPRPRPLTTRL
jgi:hypothetical protein